MITLVARLAASAADARRGVVRLHPEVLDALGLRSWDAVTLTGARVTTALAAPGDGPPGQATLDDVTLSNAGLADGAGVVVAAAGVEPARRVLLTGSRLARASVPPETLRLALLGKIVTPGDAVSLLPQDLEPAPGLDPSVARRRVAGALGGAWTTELLTVASVEPVGAVAVRPSSVVGWQDGPSTADAEPARPASSTTAAPAAPAGAPAARPAPAAPPEPVVAVEDLVGNTEPARRLAEWLELSLDRPELLARLGGSARLGVLVVGPEGVGKTTLVRSVAAAVGARCVEIAGPGVVATADAAQRVHDALATARTAARGGERVLLLVTDVDALLPAATPPPLSTLVLDALREALATPGLVLVATTSAPEALDARLRAPDLADRELGLALPDLRVRTELLRRLLASVPLTDDVDLRAVAERTPGFVVADLVALRREAAVRAALRGAEDIAQPDLLDAVGSVRPLSMSSSATLRTGGITLDQVGDMVEVKQALTEAVLWPLQYPDSFARLGVAAPRGVLVYGPPGCGKTFLLRALAGTGQLNVIAVKGAELLDKYVGESERAVRELFRRAADAAPALVFLDEVDALAPRRGGSTDSGVADRVVAALLTELDGAEPLRDVVVVGATNRPDLIDPALLRPGRLERLVYVPPPDAAARADILRAAGRNTPFAEDVDLDALGAELDGYSAADCAAVLREAALAAMRESREAAEVTGAHIAAARAAVPASLDPVQLAELAAYAERRRG